MMLMSVVFGVTFLLVALIAWDDLHLKGRASRDQTNTVSQGR